MGDAQGQRVERWPSLCLLLLAVYGDVLSRTDGHLALTSRRLPHVGSVRISGAYLRSAMRSISGLEMRFCSANAAKLRAMPSEPTNAVRANYVRLHLALRTRQGYQQTGRSCPVSSDCEPSRRAPTHGSLIGAYSFHPGYAFTPSVGEKRTGMGYY
jgi:hypothetical protein